MINKKIGIIGCGNMGEALIKGLLSKGIVTKGDIMVSEKSDERKRYIASEFALKFLASNRTLASQADIIVLAVKPQDVIQLLKEIKGVFNSGQLVISIVAGITTARIEQFINSEVAVARVMPNSPALVNQAISALCYGRYLKDPDKAVVKSIFSSLGEVVEITEDLMDAVTAISGSGPAYFFLLVEYLINMGLRFGLTREVATKLALQTGQGSLKMLVETGQDAVSLRKKVTSRGGTTEAALKVFNEMKLEEIYLKAIEAARMKARELSGG